MRIWVLTDGKAGDLQPCLGVADRVAGLMGTGQQETVIEQRVVKPGPPWVWLMPYGPVSPFIKPNSPDDPLRKPYPDIAIASGRRAVAYLRSLKQRAPECLTVFLKDPKTGTGTADIIWVPGHDTLRGPNVLVSDTGPHRISQDLLAAKRAEPNPQIAALPHPRLAVLLGGPAQKTIYDEDDLARLAENLEALANQAGSVLITASRRTPSTWLEALAPLVASKPGIVWTPHSTTDNPYQDYLACADTLVVTGDSHNMVSEALATGVPVYLFAPRQLSPKLSAFLKAVYAHELALPLDKTSHSNLVLTQHKPIDSTTMIAEKIRDKLKARKPDL
jgi:mitochondrial fission protein ELM1